MSNIQMSEKELKRLQERTNIARRLWLSMETILPEMRVKNIIEAVFDAGFKRGFEEAQSILNEIGYEIKKKE
jgi:hypothetical protein